MTAIQSRGFWLLKASSNAAFTISTTTGQHTQCLITHTVKDFLDIQSWFPMGQLAAVASHLSPGYVQEKTSSLSHSAATKSYKEWQSTPQSSLLKTEQTQLSASTQRLLVSPPEHLGVPQSSMSVPDFTSHLTTEILLLNEGLTQLRDYPKQYSAASSTVCCRRLSKCHTTSVYSVFWTAHIQSQN